MSNHESFISNDNIELLWEIIIDDDRIKTEISGTGNISQLHKYYISKLNEFHTQYNKGCID